MKAKKSLAIIGVGIIGSSRYSDGIPAFVQALQRLTQHYSITVYSFIPVDKSRAPLGVRVRFIPWKIHLRLQYVLLGILFSWDHLRVSYNVIHAQSPFPAGVLSSWLGRLYGIPWLLSYHAGEAAAIPEIPFGDLLRRSLKRISVNVSKQANMVMAMSEFQAVDIRKNLQINTVHILPRGIVVPPFEKRELSSPIRFIHISSYHPVKDHDTLLKTYALIAKKINSSLLIVGDNYGEEFQDRLNTLQLSDRVKFTGTTPHSQLAEKYHGAHILLHTSHYEGLPMVALEAMAHGVLVCGTRVGIMADLSGKCCVTVLPGDFEGLAAETLRLVEQPEEFYKIQRKAYQWVKDHDMDWYIRELKKHYDTISHQA